MAIAYAIADCDYRVADMTDYLANAYPTLAKHLDKLVFAELPTPVGEKIVSLAGSNHTISIKYDNLTSSFYGGNKLRKLEYLLTLDLEFIQVGSAKDQTSFAEYQRREQTGNEHSLAGTTLPQVSSLP